MADTGRIDHVKAKLVELLDRFVDVDCYSSEEIADHLITHGVTVQEWIPVSERLPEESGEYLTYCGEYDGICILYCDVLETKIKWRTRRKEVTHWTPILLPLPEPPKEGA